MRKFEIGRKALACAALLTGVVAASGCTSIQERRGYVIDPLLYSAVQPGIDNQRSVSATLGQPTFKSQYGTPTWYYVSSDTRQRPFARPRIAEQSVMAVTFDDAGTVAAIDRSGGERVVYLSPDSDATPTLGRERGFLEDLFGNIGAVGAAGAGAPPQ
ncbi:outer membrane protein assembly factor BamE [Qipengyuania sp.]|uniref:outer membrane protein assembly factor BamE n=1 Tax=Qipengyuania sp. TaxID=2004515 RepID=UPI0035C836E9